MRSFFILRECEQQMMSAACVESACSSLGCSFPPRKKNCDKQRERKTCLGMCWDCERVCSQVSPGCRRTCRFRRFGLQQLGRIVSKRLSQKRACFNFTFFCGIDELPNVQVLCCVKELLEQFVPELRLDGKQSSTCSCILSFVTPSPMVASCVSMSPGFLLVTTCFPCLLCVGAWL